MFVSISHGPPPTDFGVEPRTANREPRTPNPDLGTEPEHEPRSEHPEA
jgi:hypothetical protein